MTEYIERGALMEEIQKHIETIGVNAERLVARFPAADVEPVGKRTTFDEKGALDLDNFIDACNPEEGTIDGFIEDRLRTYLHALVYESVPAHMDERSDA